MKISKHKMSRWLWLVFGVTIGFFAAQLHSLFYHHIEDPWERASYQNDHGFVGSALEGYYTLLEQGEPRAALFAARILEKMDYEPEATDRLVIELLKIAATSGEGEAYRHLGDRAASGRGIARDFEQAMAYYELAEQNGDQEVWYLLARNYALGLGLERDLGRAQEFYQKAARGGHGLSAFIVSSAEVLPTPPPHSIYAAHSRTIAAAEEGSTPAQSLLCQLGINPFIVVPMHFEFCLEASRAGNAQALFRMGLIYEQSCSGELNAHRDAFIEYFDLHQNLSIARDYYQKAHEQGHTLAGKYLATIDKRSHDNCPYLDHVTATLFDTKVTLLEAHELGKGTPPRPGAAQGKLNTIALKDRANPDP